MNTKTECTVYICIQYWCADTLYIHVQYMCLLVFDFGLKVIHVMFVFCCFKFQATVELLNGVEILVCTPTSLLRLVGKTVARLDSLSHLVSQETWSLVPGVCESLQHTLAVSPSTFTFSFMYIHMYMY